MLPLVLGLIAFVILTLVGAARDSVGLGLLLSSNVESVAEARLAEPPLSMPAIYIIASAAAGAGAVLSFPEVPGLIRWVLGVLVASFLLGTIWDMRRRRGTLAVYILMRRAEIGFEPRGDVVEVPKLVFLVMNQPTPIVWLFTSIALGMAGAALLPYESWQVMLPLLAFAAAIFWLWARNRTSPWEQLARHLRWVSLRSGQSLTNELHDALDIDPEVVLLRIVAEEAVVRFITKDEHDA